MYTAASFFTGIGGLDLAAEAAGFRVSSMCETNAYCRKVLDQHWPHVPKFEDIKNVKPENIGPVDLIFGGFPCQDISNAHHADGLRGNRSGLWFELARIIRAVKPRLVIVENVSNILVRGGTTVTAQLAAFGYDGTWTTYKASQIGSPQFRERWFYVGAYVDYPDRQRRQNKASVNQLHQKAIGPHSSRQQIPQCCQNKSAFKKRGIGARAQHTGTGSKPGLDRDAYGFSAGVDIHQHKFPAGSWKRQEAHEPPRLAPPASHRAERIKALGNAVVPQQAYPFFLAARQYLDIDSA